MHKMPEHADRQEALSHIREAIALCDRLGESMVACHLQLGADLLEARAACRPASGQANR